MKKKGNTNKSYTDSSISKQIARMKNDGYSVMPATVLAGDHNTSSPLPSNILNFAGSSSSYSSSGCDCTPSDPLRIAGGFTSTGIAVPTPDEIGTPGKGYIPWGAHNNLPNAIALANSMLVYTALPLKFNIDVLCGLGVVPSYKYHSSIGCNENEDDLSYEHAGDYLQSKILKLRKELFNTLKEHRATPSADVPTPSGFKPESSVNSAPPVVIVPPSRPLPDDAPDDDTEPQNDEQLDISSLHSPDGLGYMRYADTVLDDIIKDFNKSIRNLEKEYKSWAKTNVQVNTAMASTNQARFAHDLATDLIQFNIGFVEILLSQDATKTKDSALWKPRIVGIRHRDALTCRLEEKDDSGVSRFVYISNRWLDINTVCSTDYKKGELSALPALDPSCAFTDLDARIRAFRNGAASVRDRLANAIRLRDEGSSDVSDEYIQQLELESQMFDAAHRPCRFILPIDYRTSGRFYYPQPAYWTIYRDIYQYAANIIRDRAIRKQNESMFSYILYVHQGYLERLTNQINAQKTEEEKKAIKREEIDKIKSFLANKQNNGSTLAAVTFTGSDGKDHDAFRVERVEYSNQKQTAEADKTEITDISSLIMFAFECHPDLIGSTPGGASSSGGTYQREMLLINQAKKANLQQLMLYPYYLFRDFNKLDKHLDYKIKQKTLTTLDASKTGFVEE